MKAFLAAAALLAATLPLTAEEFISGVYAETPELCAKARGEGLGAVLEGGNVVLSARGIDGYEYHRDFIQVVKGTRTPGHVVLALCEEPGYAFPDTMAIFPRAEGQLQLTAQGDNGDESGGGNSGTFHFCEGVALP